MLFQVLRICMYVCMYAIVDIDNVSEQSEFFALLLAERSMCMEFLCIFPY